MPVLIAPACTRKFSSSLWGDTRRVFFVLMMLAASPSPAQIHAPANSPVEWIQQASGFEQAIIRNDAEFPVRYRTRKVDAKGDTTREVIESREGTVARLVERNGQPLTSTEDKAEQDRLQDILRAPNDFIRHHRKDFAARGYATDLVRLLPTAMRFSYAPGQPQPPGAPGPQVVIDFAPDPGFKPPTTLSQLLTGVAGRVWIDQRTGRMTRAEGHVLHPVDFGWGVLARIHEGGAVAFEQMEGAEGRWVYSHLEEHLIILEVLLKSIPENSTMTSFDFRGLPASVSFQDAVHMLLAMPVPTHSP